MSGFNRGLLEEKLRVLSSSQHSIQTLSLWLIHHRSHAGAAVEIWLRELLAATAARKLSLVYLANDAVLQSRKSGTEIRDAFADSLEEALTHVHSGGTPKAQLSIERIINIWEERSAYSRTFLDTLRLAITKPEQQVAVALDGDFDDIDAIKSEPVALSDIITGIAGAASTAVEVDLYARKVAALPPKLFVDDAAATLGELGDVTDMAQSAKDARGVLEHAEQVFADAVAKRADCISGLETAIAQQQLELSVCQRQLTESKHNLSRATKAKRELRLHLANLPTSVATIESLGALPQDLDLDIGGGFDDDGEAKRLRMG